MYAFGKTNLGFQCRKLKLVVLTWLHAMYKVPTPVSFYNSTTFHDISEFSMTYDKQLFLH